MKTLICVTLSTFAEFDKKPLQLLQESGNKFLLNTSNRRMTKEEVIDRAKNAVVVIAGIEPYDKHVLDKLDKLRCISRCGAGIDNINLEVAKNKGIVIKNTPDVVTLPVAELTIGMIFDLLKRLTYYTQTMRLRIWEKIEGGLLSGRKVGVLGLGRIGRKVSEMLMRLGAIVYGFDLYPDVSWADKNKVQIVSKNFILKKCDIITIHIASQKIEDYIIGKKEIEVMKKGAFLVNTSRGKFLDEIALYDALKSNHLGGAALDVYSQEPYDGPLCDLNNVVLTPHIATLTRESRTLMEIEAVKNAIDFLKMGAKRDKS